MLAVGKDLVLRRQKGSARIDQIQHGSRLAISWARRCFLTVIGEVLP
jgi:hypothetical protein